MAGTSKATKDTGEVGAANDKPTCGLIMPISAMPPVYDAGHWADVRSVLEEAISAAGMRPQMVSDSFESDVIQHRIIANIFNNPVVVCDVSGLNANVMFELGMRLASKKATIIITDDIANLPFDTRVIEHVPYPRNLRIRETREFITELSSRISRANMQVSEGGFRPFLDNFTGADSAEPSVPPVTDSQYIKDQLDNLARQVGVLTRSDLSSKLDRPAYIPANRTRVTEPHKSYLFHLTGSPAEAVLKSKQIDALPGVLDVELDASLKRGTTAVVKIASSRENETVTRIQEIIER